MAERRLARMLHGDVPTLFEAPLAEDETGDVVLLGVPYEGMLVGYRHTLYPPGSRPNGFTISPAQNFYRFGLHLLANGTKSKVGIIAKKERKN